MILEDGPERRPQTFGGGVYLLVVATALTGLAITVAGVPFAPKASSTQNAPAAPTMPAISDILDPS